MGCPYFVGYAALNDKYIPVAFMHLHPAGRALHAIRDGNLEELRHVPVIFVFRV